MLFKIVNHWMFLMLYMCIYTCVGMEVVLASLQLLAKYNVISRAYVILS